VASKAELWRQRVRLGLAGLPQKKDPTARVLERVVGVPSPEFLAELAAPGREAAVLLGLVERGYGPGVLLTERAIQLSVHPGQISLPGGRLLNPDESPVAAALREAAEEVGLRAEQVDVFGPMPAMRTVSGFRVTPIVGWLASDFEPKPDPSEVQSTFEVPLAHLLGAANRRQETRMRCGTRLIGDVFLYERHRIWGATAAILAQFIEVIHGKT
jgi:8-oxo-dGTP pyrophosphatase MutT (NUDIX family)